MKIVLTTDTIHAGGAETFILRLAKALKNRNHKVFLYIFYKNRIDTKLKAAIAPDIEVVPASLYGIRWLQRFDGLLLKLKIDFSLIDVLLARELQAFLKKEKIDIIHSHLFTADRVAVAAVGSSATPIVTTMHGDYTLYWEKVERGEHIRILQYRQKMLQVLQRLKIIVCISDQQLAFFEKFRKQLPHLSISKIYNGYDVSAVQQKLSRQALGIPDESFVFGMVARGIPEKGWQEVIDAFITLNEKKSVLLLVGESDYVRALKQQYSHYTNIVFAGYSKNPVEYIRLFDAALFASTYLAESLPTVIIEYLACGVPVITTAIAECSNMLETKEGKAGVVIELQGKKLRKEDLIKSMNELMHDTGFHYKLKIRTAAAFEKFNMGACVDAYETVYRHAIGY